MTEKERDLFIYFNNRETKNLFKKFLKDLEDLLEEGDISQDDFDYMRNKILDNGNEAIRNFSDSVSKYFTIFGD